MRLIQATVPTGALPTVKAALEERGIDYFATHETGTDKYEAVLYLSVPEEEVETLLETLFEAGLGSDDHVVLIDTEIDIFGHVDGAADGTEGYKRIASAELRGQTRDLLPDIRTFVTMMVLSTIVATTGILLNSPAVIVGSMVLAPLFGPAISASAGTVIDDADLFWNGVGLQVLGVALGVASAAGFAWIMKATYLLPSGFALTAAPQVVTRLSPDLLSLIVALAAGIAGVFSIATASGRALVGVMMAAALLPPAAVVGIGVAWGEPLVAVHSAVLLVVNLLAINFAGLVTLWVLGYRPQSWIAIPQTRVALLKRGGVLLAAILVASAFLWNVTYANVQRSQTEAALEEDVSALLDTDEYANVSLVDVKVVRDRAALRHRTEKVIVTIGRPPGERHPGLHREINATVTDRLGGGIDTDIRVTLLIRERARAPPALATGRPATSASPAPAPRRAEPAR